MKSAAPAKWATIGGKTRFRLKAADPQTILRAIPHMAIEGAPP
jgi:hypothetical protein